ncbi:MAG: alpha/beta fold hydrolase, partial [Anaerolineales bacterium]|nr:alpha/beta fold hydrolase [Anaerolineales bacterium]
DKARLTPHIHAHYLNALPTPRSRKGSWVFPREIIGSTPWLAQLWAQRANLRDKRVLLAWGMKDIAFREKELSRWRVLFPQAAVVRYPDGGHFVQDEMGPELGARVAAFLAEGA